MAFRINVKEDILDKAIWILKTVGLYVIGIICLILHFCMNNFDFFSSLLNNLYDHNGYALGIFLLFKILKLGILSAGIIFPIVSTIILIRRKRINLSII